ncbi:hypothetical protein V8E54_002584 [Elaphomyces granulatus]
MPDPMSALAVASSVVGFIDFGAKLVTRFFEIRESGKDQPPKVVHLKESASELEVIASEVQKKIYSLKLNYPHHSTSLDDLHSECVDVKKHLDTQLKKLTAKSESILTHGGSQALVAIRSLWSEKDIEEWGGRVDKIRDRVMMNALMCVWDDAKKTRERTEGIGPGVGQLLDIVPRIESTMYALRDDFKKISAGQRLEDSSGQERIADALWASSGLLDLSIDLPTQYPDSPSLSASETPGSRPTTLQIRQKILDSFAFEGMTDRGERIATPYPDTFRWLFNAQGGDQPMDSQFMDFMQWLQSRDRKVFWITGKPASGKSTLMKFISTHKDLQDYLHRWAGNSPLLIATFYFWGPGSKIQKSRVGLLRSLLHQLLKQQPDLCEYVAPRRRIFFDLVGIKAESPDWNWTELQECLLRFASKTQGQARLALFVDGLDEYDGDPGELVVFLKKLHRDYDLKLCVSSRPWNIFLDEFGSSPWDPSLKMEDLTVPDIDTYIEGRLGGNPAIRDLRKIEPDSIKKLMKEIRERAQGVFLWVVLVVEQLVMTARDNPRLSIIWKTFNALPPGLEELFENMQRTIHPSMLETASKLYQLVMEWKRIWNGQIEASLLWVAVDCEDPVKPVSYLEPQKRPDIVPILKRLLEGHTKGILQVSASSIPPTVDFLHRTTFDWLRMEHNWSKIRSQEPHEFQSALTLIAVLVSRLRSLGQVSKDTPDQREYRWQHIFQILKFSREVENTPENRRKLVTVLDQMESDKLLPPLDFKAIFDGTKIPNTRTLQNDLSTLAASWCCLPFLQAKCDMSPKILHIKNWVETIRPSFFRGYNRRRPLSLLEASALGGVSRRYRHRTNWFDEARGFSQWQASQRLDTIKFLLEKKVKLDDSVKEATKIFTSRGSSSRLEGDDFEYQYWSLVEKMIDDRSNLASFDKIKHEFLPGIEACRLWEEFPEFEIPKISPGASLR